MNILFTSVGRRTYLVNYFKEALNGSGYVHVANSSDVSPAFLVADYHVVSPLIYDDNYIPFLLDYCKKNNINALISLFDIDLPVLSKNRESFEKIGVKLVVSNAEFIEICNDKWKTYQFLKTNGFNAPKTYLHVQDALNAISSGELNYPLIIKPRWGMGSIGIFEAENIEELQLLYDKTIRKIQDTYLKYESAEDISNSVLIQEKINGQEHGLDIVNDLNGNYVNTICKMKYAMRSGETDCAVTVDNEDMRNVGKRISKLSKHIANLDCDIFVKDDEIYVLEMNARFGGGYPFSHMAGVNLPLAIVKWLNNEEVDEKLLEPEIGVMSQKDINLVRLK